MPDDRKTAAPKLDDAQRAVETLVQGIEASREAAVAVIAGRKSLRMARLAAAAVRLEQELGKDDPEVRDLQARVDREDGLRVALNVRGERERRRPAAGPNEWFAYGRVLNADGTPASGFRVRLFDRDRKFDDLLGDATTDEFGDWAVGPFHARDFFEEGERAPELYVKVYGRRGKLVFTGEKEAPFPAGRVEYFEIVLDDAPGDTRSGAD